MKHLKLIRGFLAVVLAGMSTGVGGVVAWQTYVSPNVTHVAYRDTSLVESEVRDGWLYVAVETILETCELLDFAIVGARVGETPFLKWEGLDGVPDGYDRPAGFQIIRVRVNLDGAFYR